MTTSLCYKLQNKFSDLWTYHDLTLVRYELLRFSKIFFLISINNTERQLLLCIVIGKKAIIYWLLTLTKLCCCIFFYLFI